jgi:UDP-glucose 4-epimerase
MAEAGHLKGKVALVTGASGFIGTAVARRLSSCGAIVHGVSRSHGTSKHCAHWWQNDLSDVAKLRDVLQVVKPDLVFHLASMVTGARGAEFILPTLHANLLASVNLLVALSDNRDVRIVLAGSQEETQPNGAWPVPCSPYAAAKLAAGAYARMFHALYGSRAVWLRLFMVYGPEQADERKLVPYVIRSLLNDHAPALSSGTRRIDWIFIDDVAEAFLAAAIASGVEGQTIDIGSGNLVSVRETVERITQVVGTAIVPRFGAMEDRPLEVEPAADVTPAAERLGWMAKTSLADGLQKTVEWYRRQQNTLRGGAMKGGFQ